eukprot:PITA_16135
MMKLASWNCKGLGNASKAEAIKDLLKIEPSDILMLQETKIEGGALLDINKTKWKKSAGKAVSSRGSSGGLETLWTEDLFQLKKSHETQQWIFTELSHCTSKLSISLFNLYVPVTYSEKRDCWNSLSAFLEQHNPENIIIAGDFNIFLKTKEKRGGSSSKDPMLAFVEELLHQWDLLDYTPVRGLFTWSNNRSRLDHIAAHLDRFLVQSSIMLNKKIIKTKILPKLTSDHKPIQLLLDDEENLGPLPFHFNHLWIEREGFFNIVKEAWVKPISGSPSFVWEKKLKATKNHISEIKTADGKIRQGFTQVKEATNSHFRKLYSEDPQDNKEETTYFLSNIPHLIKPEDNASLISEATEEEIIKVIWSMESDKAPGPDGFTIHFYKVCWNIIKVDLQKMIKGFMRKAKIGGGTNSTYLALIPKESNPETFTRFRPISICNASYKILAKLLANRIKPLLKRLISSPQGGFVE